ncbi:MAG: hypothetical protein QG573_993 [Acidobacteriota bacterium]|jgi:hypothetical protein|nr:hypothetical protein [Thermoanaerobaculia bacterium]MBP8006835.1 hypothetical protein [Burkholderiales bacterium]MDQ1347620.1 hypothetical protein [Acidobacteriota bacterium]
MWETTEARLALLELLTGAGLKRRQAQTDAFEALAELPWTRATGRRDEIGLVEDRRHELVALLERAWPAWRGAWGELTERGLPPTPEGWVKLLDERRAGQLPTLPARLNRHTAAALAAPHSKASLTTGRRAALGPAEATHDGTVRLRPPAGLVARSAAGTVDLGTVANVLGEVAIAERAFLDGLTLEGEVRAVLLIENLGAWRDLPAPTGWLLVHVPGWDTATVGHLLERVPRTPALHFGDLDPNGARIYHHLRERRPDLIWFVPDFWAEFIDSHGRPVQWPVGLDLSPAPSWVRQLTERGLWLEQEVIVLDHRMGEGLETARAAPNHPKR